MKTIVILIPRFGMGGISKIGSFLANTLSDDYRVILISLVPDNLSSSLTNKVIRETLDFNFDDSSINKIIKQYQKVRTVFRLRHFLIKYKADLICSLGLDLGKIALLARMGTKCKTLTSERGNPARYNSVQKRRYDNVIQNTNAIVFQTQMARHAFDNCDIDSKSYIIQNPAIERNRTGYGCASIKDRHKRIVYCGRLSKEKNVDMLIDAYAMLGNYDYKLMIYGNGPEYNHIQELINKHCLQKQITIVTDCYDVFSVEGNSEIFVLTSNEEGMPNALIEAMMCGMTCIATDCPPGGCRELLDGGNRGILVPVNDSYKLCDSLSLVMNNRSLSEDLGNKAKSICDTNSVNSIQEKWKEVIRSLI